MVFFFLGICFLLLVCVEVVGLDWQSVWVRGWRGGRALLGFLDFSRFRDFEDERQYPLNWKKIATPRHKNKANNNGPTTMAVADITNFEITYKDVMAPIGYKRVMCGMDSSVGGDVTKGLHGAHSTFIWTQHGDSDQCVEEIDLVYDNEEPPPGYIKVDSDLVGGLERQCYLCYKLSSTETETKASEDERPAAVLPLCSIKICYSADHDLTGEGYTRLNKNILKGVGEAYIHYRRRQPSDRLKWSAKRLDIGDLLDVKDTVNKWCFAMVIEKDPYRRPGELKVHFTRWEGDKYDAWHNVSSNRLAEYGTRSKEETNIIPGKAWTTSVEVIENKMKKLESVRHDTYKLDEYLEKQLSVYVARCTGYNVNPKEEVIPKVYALFKLGKEIGEWGWRGGCCL